MVKEKQRLLRGMRNITRTDPKREWFYFQVDLPDSNDHRLELRYPAERVAYAALLPVRHGYRALEKDPKTPLPKIRSEVLRNFLRTTGFVNGQERTNKGSLYYAKLSKNLEDYVRQIDRGMFYAAVGKEKKKEAQKDQLTIDLQPRLF